MMHGRTKGALESQLTYTYRKGKRRPCLATRRSRTLQVKTVHKT